MPIALMNKMSKYQGLEEYTMSINLAVQLLNTSAHMIYTVSVRDRVPSTSVTSWNT